MWRLVTLIIVVMLSGCASFNLRQPERWVENNVLYSTKLPSVEVKVIPALVFLKNDEGSRFGESTEGRSRIPASVQEEKFVFRNSSKNATFTIRIETLNQSSRWNMAIPDFNNDPNILIANDETVGGIRFATGLLRFKIDGKSSLVKSFGAVVGQSGRYRLSYSEIAAEELVKKPSNLLSTDDWNYIYSFNKRANESFSIAPYSGILSPTQKDEQKKPI